MASCGAFLVAFLVASMAVLPLAAAQTDLLFMGGATSVDGVISGITSRSSPPKLPYVFKYDSVGSGAAGDNAFTPAQEITAITAFNSAVGPYGGRAGKLTMPFVVLTFSVFVSSPAITSTNRVDGPSLPPDSLASVFTDQVNTWNKVKTLTGQPVTKDAVPVKYVVRCDSSGSTKVFQSYLKIYSPIWNAATKNTASNTWPGLAVCTKNPPVTAKYRRYGSPAEGSWNMVNSVKQCVTTGRITYVQSGYGKGKGFSAAKGQYGILLAEVKLRNAAKNYLTSKTCSVLQVVPRPFPRSDGSWFAADGRLLSATGALTCPVVAFNYIFARYDYTKGVKPLNVAKAAWIKPVLTFFFTKAQDTTYLATKAVVTVSTDILKLNTVAVAKIRVA